MTGDFETVRYRTEDGVAWVELDRPEVLHAFNLRMQEELRSIWRGLREDDDVRVIVLTATGDRAFCTGIDRTETMGEDEGASRVGTRSTPFHFDDPGENIGPKTNDLWKPVVCAVNGMACAGAFYLLGEVDIIIASENATFFDPHVTYGMAAVFESIHMAQRMPLGEVLRMQLLGAHERLSATRAHQIGLVSEVVAPQDLAERAGWIAARIAEQPALPIQATVRSIWTAQELARSQALRAGVELINAGTSRAALEEGQATFASGQRVDWQLR